MPQERMTAAEYRRKMGLDVHDHTTRTVARKREEDQLQRQVCQLLDALGSRLTAVWHAVPNGGARSKAEAAIMKGLGVKAGAGDLVFAWQGGSGYIELKTDSGRLSANQRDFRCWCESASVPYVVARSPQDVIDTLREWGVIREVAG